MKPNCGGSGTGIETYTSLDELQSRVSDGIPFDFGEITSNKVLFAIRCCLLDVLGVDGVGLIQEYHQPAGDCIYRVEVLDGELLYAISLPVSSNSFNYCPADGCALR